MKQDIQLDKLFHQGISSMSATDNKKAKKRKNRKGAKTPTNSTTALSMQQSLAPSTNSEDEIQEIQKLMDAEDSVDNPITPFARGPNPYLGGEKCLLCRCERPANLKNTGESPEDAGKPGIGGLTQLPLWVCPDCRKTVEEEEKRALSGSSLLEENLRLDQPPLPLFSDLTNAESGAANGTVCTCESCAERRQIEAEHEKETQELQQCWMELRHVVRCIYREAGTGLTKNEDGETTGLPDINKMTELVHRLCQRDAHQLYQRLESQGREYVIEMKVRLLRQLTSGHKTPPQTKQFVSMLLEEYSNLCTAAKILASFLTELEKEHLKRFNLTWELHNKHLFQSIIYLDPLVQNKLPMLITQLRLGAGSKESYHEDTYPNILHRYLKFDDEMSVISVVWRDCQQLLEEYNDEQATLKAKQKMLKEDWEFFKAQRKILEQQVLKNKSTTNSHSIDAQFTETMRHILQGTKPNGDDCLCPNCNRKRCPCDECTISHMITCGIINPEVDSVPPAHHVPFNPHNPSQYVINVTPPSMSSTSSSSGSSSPINVDPERLTLPFEDCPESLDDLADEDDIPEELEDGQQTDSDDESTAEEDEDEEDDEDEDDGEDEEDDQPGGEEQPLGNENIVEDLTSACEADLLKVEPALQVPNEGGATEDCDCSHCTNQLPPPEQPAPSLLEENQCQCHACLQQSGKAVPMSLPQHIPATPRPAALHLYPHIHGPNNLQSGLHGHPGHMRPLLHPHLYELHSPVLRQQPKSLSQPQKKHPFNLDLDSQEALHEHIYHAYGEWDNAYDTTKLMLNSHKYGSGLGSELFNQPTPPLLNGNPFVTDPLSVSIASDNLTAESGKGSSLLQHSVALMKSLTSTATTNTTSTAGQVNNIHSEACFKNLKPINRTLLNQSPSKNKVTSSAAASVANSVTTATSNSSKLDPGFSPPDHCLKHNPLLHNHHNSLSSGHTPITTSQPLPSHPLSKLTPELFRSAPMKEEAVRAMGNAPLSPLALSHMCTHAHPPHSTNTSMGPVLSGMDAGGQAFPTVNPNMCPNSNALAGMNNVSVGTSTMCNDPDCDGHHEDNYDSIDDSCSEQSSSTSASNQKDGKYCDCCYCEFFGHSNPPVASTSRNYAEMRDRLRLRLKRKNEAKLEAEKTGAPSPRTDDGDDHDDALDPRGLEDLIKFINGTEEEKNGEKQLSAKAAKRARQKQRKAEEKARKLEEEHQRAMRQREEAIARQKLLQEKARLQRQRHLQTQARAAAHADSRGEETSQHTQVQKKKRGKHKESKERKEYTNDPSEPIPVDTCRQKHSSKHKGDAQNNKSTSSKPVIESSHRVHTSNTTQNQRQHLVNKEPSRSHVPNSQQRAQGCGSTPAKGKPASNTVMASNNKPEKGSSQLLEKSKKVKPQGPSQQHVSQPPNAANGSPRTATKQPKHTHSQTVCQQNNSTARLSEGQQTLQTQDQQQQQQSKKKSKKVNNPSVNALSGNTKTNGTGTSTNSAHQNNVQCTSNTNAEHQDQCRSPHVKDKSQHHKGQGPPGTPVKQHPVNEKNVENNPTLNGIIENGQNQKCNKPATKEGNNKVEEKPAKQTDQTPSNPNKSRKNRRRHKGQDDMSALDEIFMPKHDLDLENGEMDEFERELEEFKRFCHDSTPLKQREKLQVNMNLKDIFQKKKSGVSCA